MLYRFVIALQFLTRLPIRLKREPSPRDMARMLVWWPVVGLLIGAFGATVGFVVFQLSGSMVLSGVLVVGVWAAATGGLHLDGLADTFDALLSGRTGAAAGEVMKDSRVGVMGAVALFVVLAAKAAAVGLLLDGQIWAVLLAPAIGRWSAPVLGWGWRSPEWVERGIGKQLAGQVTGSMLVVSTMVVVAAGLVFARGYLWVVPMIAGCFAFLYLARRAQQVIGGVTGDIFGAAIELAETAALISAVLVG